MTDEQKVRPYDDLTIEDVKRASFESASKDMALLDTIQEKLRQEINDEIDCRGDNGLDPSEAMLMAFAISSVSSLAELTRYRMAIAKTDDSDYLDATARLMDSIGGQKANLKTN